MGQQIESLEKQLAQVLIVQQQLEEKANGTSKNSSSPPSADPPEKLFDLWHRVRDGTLAPSDFVELVKDIRLWIKSLLLEAAD